MRVVKWSLGLAALIAVALFLHYSLPSRDIVRLVGTEVTRLDVERKTETGGTVTRTRDVRYIKAVWPTGAPRVYRNEDTGWGWPPYLKFDSANLAAKADNLISAEDAPRWVIVTHYGWRIPLFSMFPNALEIEPAESPDQTLVPWFNIVLIALLIVGVLVLRRLLIMLWNRMRGRSAVRR